MHLGSRFRLATLPTPLHELPRLRDALGGPHTLPAYPDQARRRTGLAFGGNKARKLEFLVGDALRADATVLVTTGALQSNHARMTAAAARVAGMRAALVLTSETERPAMQGNLLLDHLLGAELHFIAANPDPLIAIGDAEAAKVAEVVDTLKAQGERPYVIPVGGSSAIGVLGYVTGTLEIAGQLFNLDESPSRLYYASGSRGTQAGLTLGCKMYHVPYRLCGIAVSGGEPEKTARALRIANEAAAGLGIATRVREEDLTTDHGHIGSGYGVPTAGSSEAIRLLAQTEGIFLDPVYTAKAMAGLIDDIRGGVVTANESVLFLHSGGTPALFAHVDDFLDCAR